MRKITALGLLIFGLLLGWMQSRALIGEIYQQRSQEIADRNPGSGAALKAADVSTQLTPWRPYSLADQAWRYESSDKPLEARRQFARALGWAPADAYLWAEYAQLLMLQRKFGREMDTVTRRSNHLGPTSSYIQQSNAATGLYFWTWGSAALRQQWQQSMEFMLRSNRDLFLQQVRDSGRIHLFCLGPGAHLPLGDWCAKTDLIP